MTTEPDTLTVLVRKMILHGRADQLADLMVGDSPFNLESNSVHSTNPVNREEESEVLYTARMAWEHVSFLAKFGDTQRQVIEGNKVFTAYPHYFEQWVRNGCFGLLLGDVERYLCAHPL